jgi:hypothetical protein
MTGSLLEAAFAHHTWATSRVIDTCINLSVEELDTSVLGTRGRWSKRFATSSLATRKSCSS